MTKRAVDWRAALGGLSGTVRQGRPSARALAILDSRHLVRTLFLSSAVRWGIIRHLRSGRSVGELAPTDGESVRPDRLRAWLQVGVDVGELDEVTAIEWPAAAPALWPQGTHCWSLTIVPSWNTKWVPIRGWAP